MAQVDLFVALGALWTKKPLDGDPPGPFILHRFLASDQVLAVAARYIQKDIRDPSLSFQAWRGLLPYHKKGAPRLSYVGPKKRPAEEELVTTMMRKIPERRDVVEDMVALFQLSGREQELYFYYGVEPPKEPTP